MPAFVYRAKSASGENLQGTIVANTQREAVAMLRRQSVFPLDVHDPAAKNPSSIMNWEIPRRVSTETIADTLTQLADLLTNGVSLLESLKVLAEQTADPRMSSILKDVSESVSHGTNLDQALAAHPAVFSQLSISMIRAGLEGAFLEEALDRVSSFLRKQDELRAKIVGAMTYPIILAIVGGVITTGLVIFIVPMFESFFERLTRSGVGLPLITVVLLALSKGFVKYGLLVAGAGVGIFYLVKKLVATHRGKRIADRIKLKLPLLGRIFHETAVSRFCRVLGTLLKNGVPILKSLDISSSSVGNTLLQEAIVDSAQNISSGNLLSQPLAASGLIPPQVMAMIRVAEESNTLDQVLIKIADRMDQKIERRLDVLVRLVEPIMLLSVGAMVAFIIIGILLPVFDLNSAIG